MAWENWEEKHFYYVSKHYYYYCYSIQLYVLYRDFFFYNNRDSVLYKYYITYFNAFTLSLISCFYLHFFFFGGISSSHCLSLTHLFHNLSTYVFFLFTTIVIWIFWIPLLTTESKVSTSFDYKCMGQTEYQNHLVWNNAWIFILHVKHDKKLYSMKENYQLPISEMEMFLNS